MKSRVRSRIATAAVFSALGVGALTYGLRAAPAALQAVGALKKDPGPQGQGTVATGAASPGAGSQAGAQFAFLTTGSANAAAGIAHLAAFKAGKFSGKREYAYYGYIRVQAIIGSGQLTDINILEYPSDNGRSRYINQVALPYLIQEAVDAQSYKIDLITGATFTSVAFVKSLQEALKAAGG